MAFKQQEDYSFPGAVLNSNFGRSGLLSKKHFPTSRLTKAQSEVEGGEIV